MQRLLAVQAEIAKIEEDLSALKRRKEAMETLLEEENALWRPDTSKQAPLFINPIHGDVDAAQFSLFLRETLKDGKPWSLEELKQLATQRNLEFGEKSPGRVLHFALIGMAQNGVVSQVSRGVWMLNAKGAPMNGSQ